MNRSALRALLGVCFVALALLAPAGASRASTGSVPADFRVPILLYHRLGPAVVDGMTITTAVFEEHLRTIRDKGYQVIPLRRLLDFYRGVAAPPPARSVVIVEDDAHKSVYSDMLPLVRKYRVPVTIFVYPSAVSNASYAMTWDQLRELKATGFFDFQSHTFWHPNFKREKRRLAPADYSKFVDVQLHKSKARIEKELGVQVDALAWPFGIQDEDLLRRAAEAGYRATFSIVRRPAGPKDSPMLLPRYLLTNADRGKNFAAILGEKS